MVPKILADDPFLLNTTQVFSYNPREDYEHFLNFVQIHRKCNVGSCLWQKKSILACCCMLHDKFVLCLYYSYITKEKRNMILHVMMID